MSFPVTTRGPQTAADWTAANPTLDQFEVGIEINPATGAYERAKLGDGRTAWADLAYWNPSGGPKVYRALLTQTGTDAPVATVLENTLGEVPTQSYSEPGIFRIQTPESVPVFTANKTFITITDNSELFPGGTVLYQVTARRVDVDQITINTAAADFTDTITLANGILNASIQILVYP